MSSDTAGGESRARSRALWVVKLVIGTAITGASVAGLFWLAGGIKWYEGWAFVGLLTVGQSLSALALRLKSPELLRRRGEAGKGTKAWDKVILSFFTLSYLGIMVVGALDSGRYGWSDMPAWLMAVGAGLYCVFLVAVTWTMLVNEHFEKTVRIQTDRDHRVVDSGPYRIIRHPGYVGTIVGFILSPPFILRSWWAFVPAGIGVIVLVVRTALEDRMLRKELAGYAEYAERVRYRLVPGVW